MAYFLMDLERTIQSGTICYWKGDKRGYTYKVEFAGIFSEEMADEIIKHDLDNATVKIDIKLVTKVLCKDLKMHEG